MHWFLMAIITNYYQHREPEEDKKPGLEAHTYSPIPEKLRHKEYEFEASLSYTESLSPPKWYKLNKY